MTVKVRPKEPPDKAKKQRIKAINDKYNDYKKIYKTVKVSLKSIVRNEQSIVKINKMVQTMNKIIIHTYHFIKLYILTTYNDYDKIPDINMKFVTRIIKTFCERDNRGRQFKEDDLSDNINEFHETYYKGIMNEENDISYTGLTQLIEYQATSVVTAFNNHIQEHFESFINRIVNRYFNKDEKVKIYKSQYKQEELNDFLDKLKVLKSDLLNGTDKADKKYSRFKKIFETEILKNFSVKKSLKSMLDNDPLSLMVPMINISNYSRKLELELQKEDDKDKQVNIITAFPLAKSCVPRYIDLDSKLLCLNLIGKKSTHYYNNMSKNFDNIWGEVFKMRLSVFHKKGYKFARTLSTDGVACSLLFIREDKYKPDKKCFVHQMKKPICYSEFDHLEFIDSDHKKKLSKMKIIGIDPGKEELLHATDGKTIKCTKDNGKTFRKTNDFKYTQKQRDHETRSVIYQNRILEHKQNMIIYLKNGEQLTIEQLESKLSKYNSSSCDLFEAFNYIILKNIINSKIMAHYEEDVYRRLKWYSFINRQKSEDKMIREFKAKIGDPDKEDICLIWGDFCENGNYMKGLKSSKGVGMKRIFKRAGYHNYIVNEANTSKYLFNDGRELVQCRGTRTPLALEMLTLKETSPSHTTRIRIPRPYNSWKYKSPEIISRDLNGALNILLKAKCLITNKQIPEYLKIKRKVKQIKTPMSNRTTRHALSVAH